MKMQVDSDFQPISGVLNTSLLLSNSLSEEGHCVTDWMDLQEEMEPGFKRRSLELESVFVDYVRKPRNHRYEYRAKEAMSTSDFPLLFSNVLNKRLLSEYSYVTVDWREYLGVGSVKGFRDKPVYTVSGGDAALDAVSELGEYKERAMNEATNKYKLRKFGNVMAFSFESFFQR
jgi:hypothetical protein